MSGPSIERLCDVYQRAPTKPGPAPSDTARKRC